MKIFSLAIILLSLFVTTGLSASQFRGTESTNSVSTLQQSKGREIALTAAKALGLAGCAGGIAFGLCGLYSVLNTIFTDPASIHGENQDKTLWMREEFIERKKIAPIALAYFSFATAALGYVGTKLAKNIYSSIKRLTNPEEPALKA
jgi:hypothetical protein